MIEITIDNFIKLRTTFNINFKGNNGFLKR